MCEYFLVEEQNKISSIMTRWNFTEYNLKIIMVIILINLIVHLAILFLYCIKILLHVW